VTVCDSVTITCAITSHLSSKFKIKKSKIKLKNKIKENKKKKIAIKENKIKTSLLFTILTSPPLQDFSSGKFGFYLT